MKQLQSATLLVVILLILVNFPIVGLIDGKVSDQSFPHLFLYFYSLWAVVIGFYYWKFSKKRS